jgi:hypothetical protein
MRSVAYVVPTTLRLPARPPKLVYLDLNHWVSLAKASSGHPDGPRYQEALAHCADAVERGRAVFPLSATTYMEVSRIGRYRQRHDLREVIEVVSRYAVVTPRDVILRHELEALLSALDGPSPYGVNSIPYLDFGVARAFGIVGGFRIVTRDSGEDVTDAARAAHPGGPDDFDRRLELADLELNRKTLDGPTPDEEPELRRAGWDPMVGFQAAAQRAAEELEQVRRFNAEPAWRGSRIRDVIAAREVAIELYGMLGEALDARGVTLEGVFPDPEHARAFNRMPSFDVSVTLKTAYHRNPAHRWKANHIHDIDALAATVPYCDIVVTDQEAAACANDTGLAERLNTVVCSSLDDLMSQLA